ncbi:PadR family transcriptional regulator [Streptomyces albidoflavus]|uniref:PadR family transcriptional regulator n=1 Tax=Streptomyces albidoflavus TaxID=1886 RepID=UPI00332609C4
MIRLVAAAGAVLTAIWAAGHQDQAAGILAMLLAIELVLDAFNRGEWSLRRPRVVEGIPGTLAVRRILAVLAVDAAGLWPRRITELAGVEFARALLCLDGLEMAGWARAEWETPEPVGRPRRRFYRLTETGRANALRLLGLSEWTELTS